MQNPQQQRFGAHMSIAGGVQNAFDHATNAGCDCLQVFVKNQRQWNAKPFTDDAIRAWREARAASRISPVVAHNTYLINLGSPESVNRKKSIDAFVDELERCEQLEIPYLVAHPGSHVGEGEANGLKRIAASLNEIHQQTRGLKVVTLLETTAGQGTNLGYRFEHLREIIDRAEQPERLAVCVDTCHISAAGYDIVSEEGYAETIAALDDIVGVPSIKCFHVNDSKTPTGSRVDRHEHIGKGSLTRKAFRHLVNDSRFFSVPMILETPKGEDAKGRDLDKVNLATLRRLINRSR